MESRVQEHSTKHSLLCPYDSLSQKMIQLALTTGYPRAKSTLTGLVLGSGFMKKFVVSRCHKFQCYMSAVLLKRSSVECSWNRLPCWLQKHPLTLCQPYLSMRTESPVEQVLTHGRQKGCSVYQAICCLRPWRSCEIGL